MSQRIRLFVLGFLFWVAYFQVARLFFLLYQFEATSALSLSEIFLTFIYGVRMDISMAGYFSILPGLVFAILFFAEGKMVWKFWFPYQALLLVVATFIIILDAELYVHWGFRLDATPLLYIGKEAAGSSDVWKSILLIISWLSASFVVCFLCYKLFKSKFYSLNKSYWTSFPVLVFLSICLIIPIRGSFGVAPMNTGFVYFHKKNVYANHAAVNVIWNFGYAVQKMNRLRYNDNFFDKEKSDAYFNELYPTFDSTSFLLTTKRPNIIVIALEGFTYRLIEPMGGEPRITPRFNAMIKEGILFDNFYSSGDRTDKGIVSILSGYPSQPVTSIIKDSKKTEHLPFLSAILKEQGYQTGYTYGYNIDYSNFRSYLIHSGFDDITHSGDFPSELNTSKWGVHDHYVFDKLFEETQQLSAPFFKVILTQSSHEPFDVPMETVISGDDEVSRYLNSCFYADKSLGDFIDKAKATDWWNNTLIVITADHGRHIAQSNNEFASPLRFKIPMLWIGGAVAKKDTVISTLGGHTDIPNTILGQMGLRTKEFAFSNDLLDKNYRNPFAVFVFNNGYGFKTDTTMSVFDTIGNKFINEEGNPSQKEKELGKAFMQKLYWDYNSR